MQKKYFTLIFKHIVQFSDGFGVLQMKQMQKKTSTQKQIIFVFILNEETWCFQHFGLVSGPLPSPKKNYDAPRKMFQAPRRGVSTLTLSVPPGLPNHPCLPPCWRGGGEGQGDFPSGPGVGGGSAGGRRGAVLDHLTRHSPGGPRDPLPSPLFQSLGRRTACNNAGGRQNIFPQHEVVCPFFLPENRSSTNKTVCGMLLHALQNCQVVVPFYF